MPENIGANGWFGQSLEITAYGDSDLNTKVAALIAAKTLVKHSKLIKLTYATNWEISDCPNDTVPDGIITNVEEDNYHTYRFTVDLWGYTDKASNWRPCTRILCLPYTGGTIVLKDPFQVNGSTYMYVECGTSGNPGAVIAKDEPTNYVHIII
jgi:hypothetical protein